VDAARAQLPETTLPGTPDARLRDVSPRANDGPPETGLPDSGLADSGGTGDGGGGAASGPAADLSDRERDLLAFERHWFRYAGAKEQAIRAEFGLSATRYYQLLNAVIDKPAALVTDPMLVRRLRRLRAERRRARAQRPRPAGV
jgi:Protein of unknown function (DUF3263)